MSVNANNYIMSFSSPTVPRLDASNINTISIEDMNLRIAQYEGKVTTYKNAYSNYVSLKKYIEGRLMKDLASQQNSSSKKSAFYYFSTTFGCRDLPRFAAFCRA